MNLLPENPLFNITFFVGLIFVLAGLVMYLFPPKKINYLYDYRTQRSTESQERWDFAQKFSAKELIKLGMLLSLSSVTALLSNFTHSTNLLVGLFLVIVTCILLFLRVENAFKNNFNKK